MSEDKLRDFLTRYLPDNVQRRESKEALINILCESWILHGDFNIHLGGEDKQTVTIYCTQTTSVRDGKTEVTWSSTNRPLSVAKSALLLYAQAVEFASQFETFSCEQEPTQVAPEGRQLALATLCGDHAAINGLTDWLHEQGWLEQVGQGPILLLDERDGEVIIALRSPVNHPIDTLALRREFKNTEMAPDEQAGRHAYLTAMAQWLVEEKGFVRQEFRYELG